MRFDRSLCTATFETGKTYVSRVRIREKKAKQGEYRQIEGEGKKGEGDRTNEVDRRRGKERRERER